MNHSCEPIVEESPKVQNLKIGAKNSKSRKGVLKRKSNSKLGRPKASRKQKMEKLIKTDDQKMLDYSDEVGGEIGELINESSGNSFEEKMVFLPEVDLNIEPMTSVTMEIKGELDISKIEMENK